MIWFHAQPFSSFALLSSISCSPLCFKKCICNSRSTSSFASIVRVLISPFGQIVRYSYLWFIFRLPPLILVPYSGYNQGTAGVRLPAGLLIFGLRCGFGRRYRKPFSLLADMLNASNDFVGRMPLGFQPFDQSGDFLTGHFLHATSLPFRSEVLLSLPYKHIINHSVYIVNSLVDIYKLKY